MNKVQGITQKPIIAVLGKGGVGKTAISALLSRSFIAAGIRPLLLIDADPAGGLLPVIGEKKAGTLAEVREKLIESARSAQDSEKIRLADQLDYLVLEALQERKDYSLLAIGHSQEQGCFCPLNTLLREAIDLIASSFVLVLIDGEAGIEQIKRQVTQQVNQVIIIIDGSQRSCDVMGLIRDMVGDGVRISVIANRMAVEEVWPLPKGIEWLGAVPENETVKQFDRSGRPLWELPMENEALSAVTDIVGRLGFI